MVYYFFLKCFSPQTREEDVQSGFAFSEKWLVTFPKAIVDNPRLVIVIDDFILPGIVGFQILMNIYQVE